MGTHRRGKGNCDASTSSSSDNDDYYHRHKKRYRHGRQERTHHRSWHRSSSSSSDRDYKQKWCEYSGERECTSHSIITKVGHWKVAQYQLAINAVHVSWSSSPERKQKQPSYNNIYEQNSHSMFVDRCNWNGINSSSIEGLDSQLSPRRAHLYSTDPHYYRTNTHDFGGQNLSPRASCPDVWILNHPNYASQFDMSRSESCSIPHPGLWISTKTVTESIVQAHLSNPICWTKIHSIYILITTSINVDQTLLNQESWVNTHQYFTNHRLLQIW